ncbi:MAG: hypothetical protein KZQ93_08775 [Candidatus Thiodiazotropha sp. (ex Monitilora ramsayi)]|nr:hypothetical protein [Candidatus Thiodiazotropha sp. (ex Monitilora ramsayi)]
MKIIRNNKNCYYTRSAIFLIAMMTDIALADIYPNRSRDLSVITDNIERVMVSKNATNKDQPDDIFISETNIRQTNVPMLEDHRQIQVERGTTSLSAEVEYASTYSATDPEFERDEFLARIQSYSNYQITDNTNVLLDLDLILDGEEEKLSQASRFLDHEGLNVDLLKMEYSKDTFTLFAGRYEPAEEIFPNTPAFFGNYAHYIDLDEKVGFGGSVKLNESLKGEHIITTHFFHLDTSFLSAPLFTDRGRIRKEDGGISNTGKFNNYLITVNGSNLHDEKGLSYVLGYGLQNGGLETELDERMLIGGIYHSFEASENSDIELAIEHVNLRNAGGYSEEHRTFTLGASYNQWPWSIGLVFSQRRVNSLDTFDSRSDRIYEIVGRYFVGDHVGIETAFEFLKENEEKERLFGIVIVYYFDEISHY